MGAIYMVPDDFEVIPHFSAKELKCKGGGTMRFHTGFLQELSRLRFRWGKSMTITSCCRSPAHNEAVGGHPRSLHLTENKERGGIGTLAADISIRGMDGTARGELHHLARELGWSVGLNVEKQFLHIDMRTLIGLERKDFFY